MPHKSKCILLSEKMDKQQENLEIINELPFINVRLAGSMATLENYSISKHFVQLDCAAITEPGDYELKLKYNVPKSFELIEAPLSNLMISFKEKMIIDEENAGINTDSEFSLENGESTKGN